MGGSLRWMLLALACAGCVELESDDPDRSRSSSTTSPVQGNRVAVVQTDSEFSRHEPDGTPWAPPFPGYHGCSDAFEIDRASREVRVNDVPSRDDLEQARAALSLEQRSAEAYYRNHDLFLPLALPNQTAFALGNPPTDEVLLEVQSPTDVRFDGAPLAVGEPQTFRYTYTWERSDGVVLNVSEDITVELIGVWDDPIKTRPAQYCD